MRGFSFSLRDDRGPATAVELSGHRVSAARLELRNGRPCIGAHATESLPEGMIVPSLTSSNIRDRAGVLKAMSRVLSAVGNPRRVGLVVPDSVAKVSLLRFQHVPPRHHDLAQLIGWQIRKTTPFPFEEAQVSYAEGALTPEGRDFVVSVARRDVVVEYESLCTEAGAHAGIVDLSTFNVVNAVLASGQAGAADWLLVNVAPDWASIAILRGGEIIFLRSRGADGEGTLTDLVHQTAMYYEDRLHGLGFAQAFLSGAASAGSRHAADLEQLRQSLEQWLHVALTTVDPLAAARLAEGILATPTVLDALAPLVGLLVRSREDAA